MVLGLSLRVSWICLLLISSAACYPVNKADHGGAAVFYTGGAAPLISHGGAAAGSYAGGAAPLTYAAAPGPLTYAPAPGAGPLSQLKQPVFVQQAKAPVVIQAPRKQVVQEPVFVQQAKAPLVIQYPQKQVVQEPVFVQQAKAPVVIQSPQKQVVGGSSPGVPFVPYSGGSVSTYGAQPIGNPASRASVSLAGSLHPIWSRGPALWDRDISFPLGSSVSGGSEGTSGLLSAGTASDLNAWIEARPFLDLNFLESAQGKMASGIKKISSPVPSSYIVQSRNGYVRDRQTFSHQAYEPEYPEQEVVLIKPAEAPVIGSKGGVKA